MVAMNGCGGFFKYSIRKFSTALPKWPKKIRKYEIWKTKSKDFYWTQTIIRHTFFTNTNQINREKRRR